MRINSLPYSKFLKNANESATVNELMADNWLTRANVNGFNAI